MTTDDTRDLVTTILRTVKQLLIETAGQATDLDLLNLEQRIRQEYAGCREYIAGRLPATRRYEAILQDLDKLRNMPEDLRHMWESGLQALTFFAMPVFVFLAAVGQDIAVVLLGEQWRLAGELLWIIALRGPVHVIERSHGWQHVVGGHGDRWVRWGIISCLVHLAAVACAAPFGSIGIAVAGTIAIYLLFGPAIMFSAAPFGLGAKHLARTVDPQLLSALGTIVTMIMVREMYFVDLTSYERIAAVSLLSLIVYLVVTVGLFRVTKPLRYAWSLVRDKFHTGGPSSGDSLPCTN